MTDQKLDIIERLRFIADNLKLYGDGINNEVLRLDLIRIANAIEKELD